MSVETDGAKLQFGQRMTKLERRYLHGQSTMRERDVNDPEKKTNYEMLLT